MHSMRNFSKILPHRALLRRELYDRGVFKSGGLTKSNGLKSFEQYTGRGLTFQQDKLVAISGIAREKQLHTGDRRLWVCGERGWSKIYFG